MKSGLYDEFGNKLYTWHELIKKDMIDSGNVLCFYDTNIYQHLYIDNSITEICGDCFFDTFIKEITISKYVKNIEKDSFDFSMIEEIYVENENPYFSSENGVLFNKDKTVLIRYPEKKGNKEYIIPNSVVEIGPCAFYNCKKLEYVKFSNNITKINKNAFLKCVNIKKINLPKKLKIIEKSAFAACENLRSVYIPSSVTDIKDSVFYKDYYLCQLLYDKSEEKFKKIKNYTNVFENTSLSPQHIHYNWIPSLNDLLQDGYNLRDANKIMNIKNKENNIENNDR